MVSCLTYDTYTPATAQKSMMINVGRLPLRSPFGRNGAILETINFFDSAATPRVHRYDKIFSLCVVLLFSLLCLCECLFCFVLLLAGFRSHSSEEGQNALKGKGKGEGKGKDQPQTVNTNSYTQLVRSHYQTV